ncbi:MAG: hypothetical protein RLZZ453_873 [Chlamydiota bacterium]
MTFVVFNKGVLSAIVPKAPLALGSLQVIHSKAFPFLSWSGWKDSFVSLRWVVGLFQQQGINDYMVYGKASLDQPFHWEVVPYTKSVLFLGKLWQQFCVLTAITWGRPSLSEQERSRLGEQTRQQVDRGISITQPLCRQEGKDAFCNKEIRSRQRVISGHYVDVLYDYSPIQRLHFLVVTKAHRTNFSHLTKREYKESIQLTQRLVDIYFQKGCVIAHIFHKTGALAGQSVPHWHQHIVFTKTREDELLGKLTVLKNMLIPKFPLSANELQNRVCALRQELEMGRIPGWFESAGDILQYAFPMVVGFADLIPDIKSGQYGQAMRNAGIILALIVVQNRGTLGLKKIFKKPRPCFPDDLESFPSGHIMIGTQCLIRVFFAYTHPLARMGAVALTSCLALARYLPGKHDIVDLTVGGILGVGLGCIWNRALSPQPQ